jgi:hypothetical protein
MNIWTRSAPPWHHLAMRRTNCWRRCTTC